MNTLRWKQLKKVILTVFLSVVAAFFATWLLSLPSGRPSTIPLWIGILAGLAFSEGKSIRSLLVPTIGSGIGWILALTLLGF